MGSDISRFTFDAKKHYSGVRQQQGRVNLDADWNEQVDIAAYRVSTETVDVVGACGAPRDLAGFQIQQLQLPSLMWSANTSFAQGTEIVDSNGNIQVAITEGTSGTAAPAWATSIGSAPVGDGSSGLSWQFAEGKLAGLGDLTISPGRMYVDGILCELKSTPIPIQNFTGDGTGTAGTQVQVANVIVDDLPLEPGQWVQISAQGSNAPTPLLAQITEVNAASGSVTIDANISSFGTPNTNPQLQRVITYATQPDFPSAPQLSGTGVSIVYLDVWERTITGVEDPQILDVALGGPDTATRTKVVCQVKLVDVTSVPGVTCATADSASPWEQTIQPSAGWLSNSLIQSSAPSACALAPNTGYTGMENQFYRVEIHQGGAPGTATFKWSRDNGSVETGVTAINSTTSSAGSATSQLTVQNTGRDQVLSFAPGNWVEVIDDYYELNGQAGELHQIDINGVDPTRQTITLQDAVTSPFLSRFNDPNSNYHPRIRRWDQGTTVYESDNATVWPSGINGIQVPSDGTAIILEGGITVSFGVSAAGGSFNPGDYWTFAARTATASIEPLVQAAPFGIRHHYCRLGVINFAASPWKIQDCRPIFPPLANAGLHVTKVYLPSGSQILNDGQINVQDLYSGLNVECDGPLDPATVTQPNSTASTTQPSLGAQATCLMTVSVPSMSGASVLGFNPLVLPAEVSLNSTQTTIQVTPTNASLTALANQISTVAGQLSTATPPPLAPFLASLTLKGSSIWAAGNPSVLLDGTAVGSPYADSAGVQHTGLQLPSGNGRPGSDFQMWFWLSSKPAASVSTSSLAFGNQLVGTTSAAQTITLTNNTAQTSNLTLNVTITPPTGDFAETDTCGGTTGGTLAPGASCTITVTFTPSVQGTRSNTMSINAGPGGIFTVALTGTGVAPSLIASPSSLNFGTQGVNTKSAPQTIVLTNNGTAPVDITGVSITGVGSSSTAFSVSQVVAITPVRPILPTPVIPFRPIGLAEGRALISPVSPILPVPPITPVAPVAPAPPVTPAPVAPVTPVTPVSPVIPVIPIVPVIPTGPAAPLLTLAPGAQASVSVQFSPPSYGGFNATLNISSDAPGSPLQIQLSGTAFFSILGFPIRGPIE